MSLGGVCFTGWLSSGPLQPAKGSDCNEDSTWVLKVTETGGGGVSNSCFKPGCVFGWGGKWVVREYLDSECIPVGRGRGAKMALPRVGLQRSPRGQVGLVRGHFHLWPAGSGCGQACSAFPQEHFLSSNGSRPGSKRRHRQKGSPFWQRVLWL